MRIALTASGTRGDVQPMVALGDALARRGHEIVAAVPPNLVDFAGRAGLTAHPFSSDTEEFVKSETGTRFLASGDLRSFMRLYAEIKHELAERDQATLIRVTEGADLIVADLLTENEIACIAEARRVPMACLHLSPLRGNSAVPCYLVTTAALPAPVNRLTYRLFQRLMWRQIGPDINLLRANLGLPPTRLATPARLARMGVTEIQGYSRAVIPGLAGWDPRRPLVGYLTLTPEQRHRLGEAGVDSDLDRWLADGEPPAYFGFGSLPVLDPGGMLDTVRAVCRTLNLRALVSSGWSRLGNVDDRFVRIVPSVDHTAVLPRCRLAVHHGGAGTTAASLTAGLPTVVCSTFADQPLWGRQVQRLRVGSHLRFADLTEQTLTAAVAALLDPGMARRATILASKLAAERDAAERAADLVERAAAAPSDTQHCG